MNMRKIIALLFLNLGVLLFIPSIPALAGMTPPLIDRAKLNTSCCFEDSLGLDDQLWRNLNYPGDRQALLASINNSLIYLQTEKAQAVYQQYQVAGFTRDRVRRSLVRFRQLLLTSKTPAQLQAAVKHEFVFYQSVGKDEKGTVFFTGYYEPIYSASRTPTSDYRYPLYRLPPNFTNWSKPLPTRAELEGTDGLQGAKGRLRGLELVWLRDRFEAFLVQIEGSARLQLTDGSVMTVGYDGKTDYPYTSVGRELAKDGKVPLEGLTLPVILNYFHQNPLELDHYIPRNQSFVFFKKTSNEAPKGSIGMSLTPDRSIATDKSVMPPGALALMHTEVPYRNAQGQIEQRLVSRYVLDQDTGSAIIGPGRVDYYMGTGKLAGDRSGVTGSSGQLYYLLLK
ncbi:MAG: MltA domain-containing protein [Chamaesiphon sp.]